MISWLVYRAMEASKAEQRSWSVVSDGSGWTAHDVARSYRLPVDISKKMKPTASFQRCYFKEHQEAQDFVTFQIHRAAVMAVLQPWKKIP